MTRKSNYISVVQFGEHLISRLKLHRSSKGLDIVGYDVERGDWSTRDGALGEALRGFCAKHGVGEDQVFTVIARHEMTARILELPSQDAAEVAGMIRLSAEEYVPFPVQELVIDQCILQKLPDGRSKVLAVFAHQDVVNAHVKALQQADIEPEQIYLSTACLASAAMEAKEGTGRYALVNLASDGLEVVVVNGGRLEYGRAVASTQDWSAPGSWDGEAAEELRVEIRASLSAYRRDSEDGESVEQVYLSSDFADVSGYCSGLSQEFGQECSRADFAGVLASSGAEHIESLPMASLGAGLLAQGRGAVCIELLPDSLLSARQRTGMKRKAMQAGALAAVVLVAFGMLYGQAVYQRRAYLSELREQISRIEPAAQQIASKQKQLRILQTQVERRGSVVELLAALVDLYPAAGMNITRLVFSHQEGLEVYGRAESLTQVEQLAQDLIDVGKATLPQFARAEQQYEHKVQERHREVFDYKILAPFPSVEKAELEEDEEATEDVE